MLMLDDINSEPRSTYAVHMQNVTFGYNKNATVLKNCNLRINQGEIFALLGSNGCGKTTILKLISGRAKPISGWVRVFGLQPGDKHSNIPGPGIGYMPQEISLFLEFTVEENLKYFAKLFHLSSDEFEERCEHLTQLLNLSERGRRITKLSGGQQRLLSMAVTIIHSPKLIILDEPTVGVDPILRSRIWTYLEDLCNKNGNTVIITTHYIEEAKRASNVGFMKSGSILRQSNPQNLINEYQCTTLEGVFLRLWHQKDLRADKSMTSDVDLSPDLVIDNNENTSDIKSNYSKKLFDIRRGFALLWKFNLRVKKFPLFAVSFIAIPFLTLFSLYISTGHLPHDIPVAVHSYEPEAIHTNQFIESISGEFLSVIQYDTKELAVDSLYKGKNIFAIFFAHNFSDEFESRLLDPYKKNDEEEDNKSIIKLYIDSSRAVTLAYGLQYLAQVFQNFVTNVSISLGLNPNSFSLPLTIEEPIYGIHPITGKPSDKFRVTYDYLAPSFLMVAFHLSSMVFSAFVILNNRRCSQMNRYFVSGGQPIEVIVTHYLSIISYIVIQIFILLVCASFLFDIKQEGSYVEVYLICFLQSLQGLSIGLLLALIFKQEFSIGVTLAALMFPTYVMSGVFWPLEGIPTYFREIADWTFLSKPIDSLRCIMLRGWDYTHPNVMMGYVVSVSYTLVISVVSVIFFEKYQEPII